MSTSPTQRSLEKLRSEGWTAQVVERWNQWAKVRQDLFGFIDILCLSPSKGILGVQTTSGSNVSARLAKIKAEPKAGIFLAAGGKIMIHGWAKQGPRGSRKTWVCREIPFQPTPESLFLDTKSKG
jgi:hypothetical protein